MTSDESGKATRFAVMVSADATTATMKSQRWSLKCPVADLAKWLTIYRGFIKKRPSTSTFYQPCVIAIENAMRRVGLDPKEIAENKRIKR